MHDSYIDALTTILVEYLDTKNVTPSKYAVRFRNAIHNQHRIGFGHFFMGKISQQWLILFQNKRPGDFNDDLDPSNIHLYSWGGKVIELTLKKMIELWEVRNKEVHGVSNEEIEEI